MIDQAEIHRMAQSQDISIRVSATEALGLEFHHLIDKEQAWGDLLALVIDEHICVQESATEALGLIFSHLVDKEQAWNDLLALVKDKDIRVLSVRVSISIALGSAFPHLTDKEQATKDLLTLIKDEDGNVRGNTAIVLGSVFPGLTDKEQATKDLLALIKDEDGNVRWSAVMALGSVFPYLKYKEQVWDDLLALLKDKANDMKPQLSAVIALGSAFPHLTDKEQALKNLLSFAKDEDVRTRLSAALALGSVFPHLIDKEQAFKYLLALAKDEYRIVRWGAANALSSAAKYFIGEKNFKKSFQCFSEASSAFKYDLLEHIKPESEFYLYKGFGCYCQGRGLMNELPEKNPDEYVMNIKKAVGFLNRSIKYINKSGIYENETRLFPICLNIYSALYEYNLFCLNFDEKRIAIIKDYLDNASAQCKIVDNKQGENLVRIIEKLTLSMKIRLEGIKQEKKKCKAAKKGKGGGWDAKYESHIDKLESDFKESLAELNSALNKLDAPLFKKIAMIEIESLEKLQSSEPKTSWQRLRKFIHDFIKRFWKIITTIGVGVIIVLVERIIKNWQFILDMITNLLT